MDENCPVCGDPPTLGSARETEQARVRMHNGADPVIMTLTCSSCGWHYTDSEMGSVLRLLVIGEVDRG